MHLSNEGFDTFTAFAATYAALEDAEADYGAVKALYDEDADLGTFDAAVLSRDDKGKVTVVHKHEEPTKQGRRAGGKIGLAAGLVAALIPGIGLGIAVVGTGIGAAIGHIAGHAVGGLSKSDLNDLGETLHAGECALVVVTPRFAAERVAATITHADKIERKDLTAEGSDGEEEEGTAYPASPTAQ